MEWNFFLLVYTFFPTVPHPTSVHEFWFSGRIGALFSAHVFRPHHLCYTDSYKCKPTRLCEGHASDGKLLLEWKEIFLWINTTLNPIHHGCWANEKKIKEHPFFFFFFENILLHFSKDFCFKFLLKVLWSLSHVALDVL